MNHLELKVLNVSIEVCKVYVKKFYFRLSRFNIDLDDLNINFFEDYLANFDFIIKGHESSAAKSFYNFSKKISKSFK